MYQVFELSGPSFPGQERCGVGSNTEIETRCDWLRQLVLANGEYQAAKLVCEYAALRPMQLAPDDKKLALLGRTLKRGTHPGCVPGGSTPIQCEFPCDRCGLHGPDFCNSTTFAQFRSAIPTHQGALQWMRTDLVRLVLGVVNRIFATRFVCRRVYFLFPVNRVTR